MGIYLPLGGTVFEIVGYGTARTEEGRGWRRKVAESEAGVQQEEFNYFYYMYNVENSGKTYRSWENPDPTKVYVKGSRTTV